MTPVGLVGGGMIGWIPALPLMGFLILALAGRRLPRIGAAVVGVGSVALSFALVVLAGLQGEAAQTLWTWFSVGGLEPAIALRLDPLSLIWAVVITGVGALIHLYAVEYMWGDEDFPRFFASMNLFVCAMLLLVLADDLLLLYLGWEGVGLCSYLLIGFWYRDPANGRAARKAFVVTRVGDAAMAIGLILIAVHTGTLRIPEVLQAASASFGEGDPTIVLITALLLVGAIGKSAQLPLHIWLPDAMAGPTPVSALIHAATMVTAGVYLIARTHVLFLLAPTVLDVVAVVGAATLLLAGLTALAQDDLKRVLAWSTISQIGYMFLALGVGAWTAAVFHFAMHAAFKALLFLAAGSVLLATHHEQDMRRLSGLRRVLPVPFWTFLVGSLSLAGFPLVTAGFYSKEQIIAGAAAAHVGAIWLWGAALVGALITAIYIFRAVFLVFFGEPSHQPDHPPGWPAKIVLVSLAVLSLVGGLVWFPEMLEPVLPAAGHQEGILGEVALIALGAGASILGIAIAWWLFLPRPEQKEPSALYRFAASGFGLDALFHLVFLRPFVEGGALNRRDVVDLGPAGAAGLTGWLHRAVRTTQNGNVRWYVGGVAVGAVLVLGVALWGAA